MPGIILINDILIVQSLFTITSNFSIDCCNLVSLNDEGI